MSYVSVAAGLILLIRACEAEWLMMHALLAPVENITD